MQRMFLLTAVLFLAGCATVNVPGNTTADPRLKGDIANMINTIERAQVPGCSHGVVDTKVIGVEGTTVKEEWTVASCGKNIVYPVELTPDPKGGSYFGVTTPARDARK